MIDLACSRNAAAVVRRDPDQGFAACTYFGIAPEGVIAWSAYWADVISSLSLRRPVRTSAAPGVHVGGPRFVADLSELLESSASLLLFAVHDRKSDMAIERLSSLGGTVLTRPLTVADGIEERTAVAR